MTQQASSAGARRPTRRGGVLGRPADQRPRGTLKLLLDATRALRRHLGHLLAVSFCAGLSVVVLGMVVVVPSILLLGGYGESAPFLAVPLAWPLVVPVAVGYAYTILLVLQGRRAQAKEIFRAIESRRLYFNVLLAGLIPFIGYWMGGMLRSLLSQMLPAWGHPVVDRLVLDLPQVGVNVVLLPFAFAGLDALARRSAFTQAIRRSLRFAVDSTGLFGGYALLFLAASVLSSLVFALMQAWSVSGSVSCVLYFGSLPLVLAGTVLSVILASVVHVEFYREFVWREREAAERNAP